LNQPSGSCFDDLLRKEEAQVRDAMETSLKKMEPNSGEKEAIVAAEDF
jgi:hypothetical protein